MKNTVDDSLRDHRSTRRVEKLFGENEDFIDFFVHFLAMRGENK